MIDFCKYGMAGCGKRCCFHCQTKCKEFACTLKCQEFHKRNRDQVVIHYAAKNQAPAPKWRDITGAVLCTGRGKGPRNVLVKTAKGKVVVPRLNVRYLKKAASDE
jgi:hypothetical protein